MRVPCFFIVCWLSLTGCNRGDLEVIALAPGSLRVDMVAHYAAEGEMTGQLVDTSGNGHHGVLSGVSRVEGKFGSGFRFQSGNFASVPNFPQATPSYSVSLWTRPMAGQYADPICTLVSTEAVFVGGWEMNVNLSSTDTRYHFGFPYGGDANYSYNHVDNFRVKMGEWAHLVAVMDARTMRLRFYIDGVLVDDQPAVTLIQRGSTTLYLGRWLGEGRFYVGDLDDIAMYNRALDAAEVRALYAAPAPDPQ